MVMVTAMAEVYEEHRHLYHYTDWAGLEGILGSQTLWARHYKALNDTSEVQHMRGLLYRETHRIVNNIMRRDARRSFKYKRFLKKHGGVSKCSRMVAKQSVDIFYRTTFEGDDSGEPFAEPYVVSFCAHTNHDRYVQDNGLLSMWRAYGNDGGYALVFDTKRLSKCLDSEAKYYGYSALYLADVIYDDAEEGVLEKEIGQLVEVIRTFIEALAEGVGDESAGKVFQPFFTSVTRFKHQGFKEESEVRLTAAPIPKRVYEKAEADYGEKPNREIKPILTRKAPGKESPYIVLNDSPKRGRLPILKIIVGPQEDQAARLKEVRVLIGRKRIKVVGSSTPYVPV